MGPVRSKRCWLLAKVRGFLKATADTVGSEDGGQPLEEEKGASRFPASLCAEPNLHSLTWSQGSPPQACQLQCRQIDVGLVTHILVVGESEFSRNWALLFSVCAHVYTGVHACICIYMSTSMYYLYINIIIYKYTQHIYINIFYI